MSLVARGIAFAAGAGLAISLVAKINNQSARQELIEAEVERRLREHAAATDQHVLQVRAELEGDFARSVDRAVAEHVVTLERELLEQSVAIQALRFRGEAAEIHMQRLIELVKQVVPQRGEEFTVPAGFPASFEAQLERALENPQSQKEFRESPTGNRA